MEPLKKCNIKKNPFNPALNDENDLKHMSWTHKNSQHIINNCAFIVSKIGLLSFKTTKRDSVLCTIYDSVRSLRAVRIKKQMAYFFLK